MKFFKGIGVATGLAMALAGSSAAFAKGPVGPSGNLNLRIDGYEVFTPTGEAAGQYTINGLGQVIGDSTGSLSGTLTYTQVDALTATEDVCADPVTGITTAPTGSFSQPDGSFTIALSLTSPPTNPTGCGAATIDLLCNRTLVHQNLRPDLDAGTYHCIATSVTGGSAIPASLTVRIGSVEGANAPTD